MPIRTHTNDIKERLSVAYVTAVAARAGCQIIHLHVDKQSIDATVRPISGSKISVDLQLKSTSRDCLKENEISFPLPIKNYDDLRTSVSTALHFLVVLVLEPAELDWLVSDENSLLIKRCAYWVDLRGSPPVRNETSVTISIPRSQIFDVQALQIMMQKAYDAINQEQEVGQ
ncbi:DUF4365 domain-containing protein [uncultured Agrobacterium sp.]|uniref:DUF4365 domain-containing protein n=1 Tax=uncultured Agrobacterium sp. TaxID=157277 RepID=UPI0025EFABE3|nr:DUF4365 domain-containing protein [uncultured Agrobacterium sp.]